MLVCVRLCLCLIAHVLFLVCITDIFDVISYPVFVSEMEERVLLLLKWL